MPGSVGQTYATVRIYLNGTAFRNILQSLLRQSLRIVHCAVPLTGEPGQDLGVCIRV